MTYIYADRHNVNIEIEMDAIVHELPSDFLISLVIDRSIETEMLSAIDDETIIEYVRSNKLDSNVDLSTVDDDDLLNEVKQRNMFVVPWDAVNAIDTLVRLLPRDAGRRFV